MSQYYVLQATEDGVYLTHYESAEKLEQDLENGEIDISSGVITSPWTLRRNINDWGCGDVIIIKGEAIEPKPIETVTKYKL